MNISQQDRQDWMSTLAKSNAIQLLSLSEQYIEEHAFETIRAAEIGLTQVRGRMGGTGSEFNLGDMTMTRCVVRSKEGHYGHSYIAGRNKEHATRAAQLDALLQSPNQYLLLHKQIVTPLACQLAQQQQEQANETAQTKVNFFTLVRGED